MGMPNQYYLQQSGFWFYQLINAHIFSAVSVHASGRRVGPVAYGPAGCCWPRQLIVTLKWRQQPEKTALIVAIIFQLVQPTAIWLITWRPLNTCQIMWSMASPNNPMPCGVYCRFFGMNWQQLVVSQRIGFLQYTICRITQNATVTWSSKGRLRGIYEVPLPSQGMVVKAWVASLYFHYKIFMCYPCGPEHFGGKANPSQPSNQTLVCW